MGNGVHGDDLGTPEELSADEIEFTNSFDALNEGVSTAPPPRKKANQSLRATGAVNSSPTFGLMTGRQVIHVSKRADCRAERRRSSSNFITR